jgi:hypothetical protein
MCSSCLLRSQSEKQKHGNAENDGNKPEQFDGESPLFWVKWHASFLATVERRQH